MLGFSGIPDGCPPSVSIFCLNLCPFCPRPPEADDLAQYLDHLLAHAAPKKPKRQVGGLGRFKAVATKTKEMVSLMNKAQDLDVHSERIRHLDTI